MRGRRTTRPTLLSRSSATGGARHREYRKLVIGPFAFALFQQCRCVPAAAAENDGISVLGLSVVTSSGNLVFALAFVPLVTFRVVSDCDHDARRSCPSSQPSTSAMA